VFVFTGLRSVQIIGGSCSVLWVGGVGYGIKERNEDLDEGLS